MTNLKRSFITAIFALSIFAVLTSTLSALEVPALRGRVNDYANMLSQSTVRSLDSALAQLEQTDSTQVVVLTINSLEGDALEDFSIHVAEKWQIGHKGRDNGAILLISKNDRKIRIEVGYGLEGKLTDLISGRIIDDIITTNFRKSDYDAGVEQGIDAIIKTVRGEFTAEDFKRQSTGPEEFSFSGKYIFLVLFFLFMISSISKIGKIFSGIIGAILLPVIALILLPIGIWILFLIPVGFFLGLIMPFMGGTGGHYRGGGGFGGFGGGGFSSGGGGFSGGGGGFGGGGASGGW